MAGDDAWKAARGCASLRTADVAGYPRASSRVDQDVPLCVPLDADAAHAGCALAYRGRPGRAQVPACPVPPAPGSPRAGPPWTRLAGPRRGRAAGAASPPRVVERSGSRPSTFAVEGAGRRGPRRTSGATASVIAQSGPRARTRLAAQAEQAVEGDAPSITRMRSSGVRGPRRRARVVFGHGRCHADHFTEGDGPAQPRPRDVPFSGGRPYRRRGGPAGGGRTA
mgnify:CR=1 FL=1